MAVMTLALVPESGSEGNAGGFATEDDARFATSTLSFSKSLSIFLWRRFGGLVVWWVVSSGGEWLPGVAVEEV
uniref:Uncharacterized protein n=1 Tax=Fagus sylvatica TaxID=28930 RepID=A0A2N9G4A3_FAGSY